AYHCHEQSRSAWSRRRRGPIERPRLAAPASRRKRYPRPEGSKMTVRARHRSQAEDSLRLDQSLSEPQSKMDNVESNMREPHPCQQLTQMIPSYRVSRAVYIAAKLRIADHLKGGPRTAEELAATAGVAPRPLHRCEPGSLRAFAIMQGEEQYRCWDDLLETV